MHKIQKMTTEYEAMMEWGESETGEETEWKARKVILGKWAIEKATLLKNCNMAFTTGIKNVAVSRLY